MLYISFDIGVKNLALCILKQTDSLIKVIDWRVITLAEKKKDINGLNTISENLFYELDNIVGSIEELKYEKIDYVLIENQPSNLNGIMKSIQLLIFSYFMLLKHWDKLNMNVLLINASLKLQYHTFKPEPLIKIDSQRTKKEQKRDKYRNNKNDGIEITKYYIKDNKILYDYFTKHKKKDDLADTLLQTISYIKKHNNLVIEEVSISENNLLV
jgi:hypothetical protein